MKKLCLLALFFLVCVTPATSYASELPPLKVALLPILDSLPAFIAQKLGYFEQQGLDVELLTVTGGPMRDQLMQVGEIDGMLNEMTTTAVFNRESRQAVILSLARESAPGQPMFRIVASPKAKVTDLKGMVGGEVAVSRHTIIEYVTDRLLARHGVDSSTVDILSVPAIPERFQLLMQGRLQAATLPDPLAWSALKTGGKLLADDAEAPELAVSVLTFSASSLEAKPDAVRAFLAAWDQAAAKLNAEPQTMRPLTLEAVRMPPNAQKDFPLPVYPRGKVPTEAQWNDVMDWMLTQGLLDAPVAYETSVDPAYLPKVE